MVDAVTSEAVSRAEVAQVWKNREFLRNLGLNLAQNTAIDGRYQSVRTDFPCKINREFCTRIRERLDGIRDLFRRNRDFLRPEFGTPHPATPQSRIAPSPQEYKEYTADWPGMNRRSTVEGRCANSSAARCAGVRETTCPFETTASRPSIGATTRSAKSVVRMRAGAGQPGPKNRLSTSIGSRPVIPRTADYRSVAKPRRRRPPAAFRPFPP